MSNEMGGRERFLRAMRYQDADRRPIYLAGVWDDTLARWRREGLPEGADPHEVLGVKRFGYPTSNVSPMTGIFPRFEQRVLREDKEFVDSIDSYGRTVRNFRGQTSMPEWLEYPVKDADGLRRLLDEHFDVGDLDARFPPDWEAKAKAAQARGDVLMVDGGCYYFTLCGVAGVETASYLLHDCPELVDELFERYFTVVMEAFRRTVKIVQVDLVGFAEDFAFKTGPLISPAMFRQFIQPRYRKFLDVARQHGADFTWHDSDGDTHLLLPDMLDAGVNGIWPCEAAANMDPVQLRRQFGKTLRMGSGFDKRLISQGPAAVRAELERLAPLIREGGFIPGVDHSVPAEVSWDNYRTYIELMVNATAL